MISLENQFQGIQVSGIGKATIAPDQARITLSVQMSGNTASEALHANSKKMQEVFKSLQTAGVEGKDMQTSQLNVSAVYTYPKNKPPKLSSYSAFNSLIIKVHKLDTVGALVDAAVQAGINQVTSIGFESTKADETNKKALQLALANAKVKAQLVAEAEGVKLGVLISLVEENIQAQPFRAQSFARAEDSGGEPPVAAGELTVTATITAVYEIEEPLAP